MQYSDDVVEKLHKNASFSFSIGYDYVAVNLYMTFLLNCITEENPLYESVLWGKMVSSVIVEKFDEALQCCSLISSFLSAKYHSNSTQFIHKLKQLMHTMVLIFYFHGTSDFEYMLQLFLSEGKFNNGCAFLAPHLVKYLFIAAIVDIECLKNCRKSLASLIYQVRDIHTDPFIELFEVLFINHKMDKVPNTIEQCLKFMEADYAASNVIDEFKLKLALIFATNQAKIFRSVSLAEVAKEFQISEQKLTQLTEDSLKQNIFSGKINEEGELECNISQGRTENLVEKCEELLLRCNELYKAC